MSTTWSYLATIISGAAAVVALVISVRAIRTHRRAPLAAAYLQAWDQLVDVVVHVGESGPDPIGAREPDELRETMRTAVARLTRLEPVLGVKAFRSDLLGAVPQTENLTLSALYGAEPVGEFWSEARPCEIDAAIWPKLGESTLLSVIYCDDMLDSIPIRPYRAGNELMSRFARDVIRDFTYADSVCSPLASAQQQLAYLVSTYHREYLTPWITMATREALTGRRGRTGNRLLWQHWNHRSRIGRKIAWWRAWKVRRDLPLELPN